MCNYTGDGGRPSEAGLQGQASNHRELRGSRARVVSVTEKAWLRPRQVGDRKTNASEPLRTCRKRKPTSKLGSRTDPGQAQGVPAYGLGGVRHEGGVSLSQALVWNVGTCRLNVKGDTQMADP